MNDERLGELAAVISVLSEHRAILHDLSGFEPVGSLAESIRGVIVGSEALSRSDLDRLRIWSARWTSLDASVRTFYRIGLRETEPNDGHRLTLERSIWRLVDPATDRWADDDWLRTSLNRIHTNLLGRPAGIDLLPLPSPEAPR